VATKILYTTTDAIRGCLGVDGYDVEESMLVNAGLDKLMLLRLMSILPNHEAVFDTEEGELRLTVWAQLYGALMFIGTGQLAVAKKYAANQDTMERFDIDFLALVENLKRRIGALEKELNPAVGAIYPTGMFTLVSKAEPEYDPVTGVAGGG